MIANRPVVKAPYLRDGGFLVHTGLFIMHKPELSAWTRQTCTLMGVKGRPTVGAVDTEGLRGQVGNEVEHNQPGWICPFTRELSAQSVSRE